MASCMSKLLVVFVFAFSVLESFGQQQTTQEVPQVSFRMLEYPLKPIFDNKEKVTLPSIEVIQFHSPLLRDRLEAVQQAAAHAIAKNNVPMAVKQEIAQIIRSDSPLVLRRAAVSAAIHLEQQDLAEELMSLLDSDPIAGAQIEAALARWQYRPARAIWLRRLSEKCDDGLRTLAVHGLLQVPDPSDRQVLEPAYRNEQNPAIRIELAKALAAADADTAWTLAEERLALFRETASPDAALEGIELLRRVAPSNSETLLTSLAESDIDIVAEAAFRMLMTANFHGRSDLARRGCLSTNANIRRSSRDALFAAKSGDDAELLSEGLADPIKSNRIAVSRGLLAWAREESHLSDVRRVTAIQLIGESWRGREQAILVLTQLRDFTAIPKLFELLNDSSPEVFVTAAWALREMAGGGIEAENVLQSATKFADQTKIVNAPVPTTVHDHHRIAHLLELLGELRYEPASEFLVGFVGKSSGYHTVARAASIWALGSIHQNHPEAACLKPIVERMMDFRSQSPENVFVRFQATVAAGRMGDRSLLPQIRQIPEPSFTPLGQARDWAIKNIQSRYPE